MVHLDQLGILLKRERLVIKCETKKTIIRFKRFAADYLDYEEAINKLLDLAEDKGYRLRV